MNPVKARLCARPEDWPYSSANGKFYLDSMPEKYQNLASGTKAQIQSDFTQGLKPLPPKETEKIGRTLGHFANVANVGPEGPTPVVPTSVGTPQRLMPLLPKGEEKNTVESKVQRK